jgi:hypothetical protein
MATAGRVRTRFNWKPWLSWLAFVGLAALIPFGFYLWILNLDNQGTFYVSASFADIDGDGDLDVIAQNLRQESAVTAFGGPQVWLNQGNRSFTRQIYELPLGESGGWDSTVADMDQDGDPDLVRYLGYALRIDLNQGGAQGGTPGVFRSRYSIPDLPTKSQFGTVIVGDVNGDGWPDVLVGGRAQMVVPDENQASLPGHSWLWLNSPDDQVRQKSGRVEIADLAGVPVGELALGDLDGDGDLDLFAAVLDATGIRVLENDGAGIFSDTGQRLGKTSSTSAALADIDGDGDLDALVGTEQGAELWLNQGGAQGGLVGTFARSPQEFDTLPVRRVFLADLDGDGDSDALIGGVSQAVVWQNDGQGQFSRVGRPINYTHRHGLAVGDLNGDGRPDIWVGKYDNRMRIWYNQGDGTFR